MDFHSYPERALQHLQSLIPLNQAAIQAVGAELIKRVRAGGSLFVFGSGHSALFPLELFHRAGGASFVIPVAPEELMPNAGPNRVRARERTPGFVAPALARAEFKSGDMVWIASQSGINSSGIDAAIEAKRIGASTVAFTSRVHSSAVESRHPSKRKLMDCVDHVIDLGGEVGDAVIALAPDLKAGPVSSLGSILLGHTILVGVCRELEASGHRCVYVSVNTPEGEKRNRSLEIESSKRDPLLRLE